MNCNCKKEIETNLRLRLEDTEPNSTGHKVQLMGYGLVLTENKFVSRPFMEYETFAFVPLKKGGSKPKKTTGNMFFSYCPFCGEKI